MNPGGPVEEAGATARGLIDALKAQPAVLALTIANFALLAFIFYALHSAGKFRETLLNQVFANTARIHDMMQQRSVACPDQHGALEPLKPLDTVEEPHKRSEVEVAPLKPIE